MTGVDLVHVPYRGSTPAVTDLIAGQVQVMFDVTPTSVPQIKGGKLRALGVATPNRIPSLPDVPPVADTVEGLRSQRPGSVSAHPEERRPRSSPCSTRR